MNGYNKQCVLAYIRKPQYLMTEKHLAKLADDGDKVGASSQLNTVIYMNCLL